MVKDNKSASPITYHREVEKRDSSAEQNRSDKKKNLISISKSLELEKNLGVKKDLEDRKSKEKVFSAIDVQICLFLMKWLQFRKGLGRILGLRICSHY